MMVVDPFKAFDSPGTGLQLPVGAHTVPVRAIVFVVLLVLLIAVLPAWPYSRAWGAPAASVVGLLLLLLLVVSMFGYL